MTLPTAKAKLLEGKRGLIIGIANDQSIAWGCGRAFHALGAELALTYLIRQGQAPCGAARARGPNADSFLPLDVMQEGQMKGK